MTSLAITLSCALLLVAAPSAQQTPTVKPAPGAKQAQAAKPAPTPPPVDDAVTKIDVRVTTTTPGSVIVDRGAADGIMRGDRVVLQTKDGKSYEGFVDQPLERISRVELADSGVSIAAGTRGEILIAKLRLRKSTAPAKPKSTATTPAGSTGTKKRTATTKTPLTAPADVKPAGSGSATVKPPSAGKPTTKPKPAATGGKTSGAKPATAATAASKTGQPKAGAPKTGASKTGAKTAQGKQSTPPTKPAAKTSTSKKPATTDAKKSAEAAEHSPWKTQDEGWSNDKPLLSQLKPLRPEERSSRIHGIAWMLFDTNHYDESDGTNTVYRAGTSFDFENPFDEGGAIHFDVEANRYEARSDGADFHLLARRLSYSKGGTRFDANRFEFGRFLQNGMPEFGFLDGVEWGHRSSDGTRFGASLGYMPEPDEDFSSFHDPQVAAWYQWAADESERLTVTGGVQATFHDGDSDRDLLVVKARYLPGDGWDFHCATWVDYYGTDDDAKDTNLEVTQAFWSFGRRYDDGGWWDLTYRHIAFPDIDREGEFDPITAAAIEDNKSDRAMLSGSTWWSKKTRLHASAGGWNDEDESGGAGDLGIEFPGILVDDSQMDLTLFGSKGQFTQVVGGRLAWGGYLENGRWDVFYEFADHQNDGFDLDLQYVDQHRFYATRTLYFPSGWTISATGGGLLIDDELAWSIGLFVQKSF